MTTYVSSRFAARLAGLTLAGFLLLTGAACQKNPRDTQRGYALEGVPATERVDDWSFTDSIQEIYIETNPWYGIPHSVTIWCATLDGDLYIGSYRERKSWVDTVESRPGARLGIDGRIYEVSIGPRIEDPELVRRLDEAYDAKYDMEAVWGDDIPKWWYYPVTQR